MVGGFISNIFWLGYSEQCIKTHICGSTIYVLLVWILEVTERKEVPQAQAFIKVLYSHPTYYSLISSGLHLYEACSINVISAKCPWTPY